MMETGKEGEKTSVQIAEDLSSSNHTQPRFSKAKSRPKRHHFQKQSWCIRLLQNLANQRGSRAAAQRTPAMTLVCGVDLLFLEHLGPTLWSERASLDQKAGHPSRTLAVS